MSGPEPRRVLPWLDQLFQEVPSALTLVGAAIIIGATLYITLRERRLGVTKTPSERAD